MSDKSFSSVYEAIASIETFVQSCDELKVGDLVVLSDHGQKTRRFPNKDNNQVGKIMDIKYTPHIKGDALAQYVVAVAVSDKSKFSTSYGDVYVFSYWRQELEKYVMKTPDNVVHH